MTQEYDPFAATAAFYDLDLEDYDGDVEFYERLLSELPTTGADATGEDGGVLELGCGTARVALALARSGHAVAGVDISTAMLDIASAHLAAEPALDGSLELIKGDMRTLDLGRRFGAVLVPLGGLQHMESIDDLAAALATVARHLAPGGFAVIDVEPPHPEDLESGQQPVVEHWTRNWSPDGDGGPVGQVTKLVSIDPEPAQGLRHITWHFDVQPFEGPLHRRTQQFSLRVVTSGELDLAARLAGLFVSDWYGDYDGAPYDDGSERIVAVLQAEDGEAENAP